MKSLESKVFKPVFAYKSSPFSFTFPIYENDGAFYVSEAIDNKINNFIRVKNLNIEEDVVEISNSLIEESRIGDPGLTCLLVEDKAILGSSKEVKEKLNHEILPKYEKTLVSKPFKKLELLKAAGKTRVDISEQLLVCFKFLYGIGDSYAEKWLYNTLDLLVGGGTHKPITYGEYSKAESAVSEYLRDPVENNVFQEENNNTLIRKHFKANEFNKVIEIFEGDTFYPSVSSLEKVSLSYLSVKSFSEAKEVFEEYLSEKEKITIRDLRQYKKILSLNPGNPKMPLKGEDLFKLKILNIQENIIKGLNPAEVEKMLNEICEMVNSLDTISGELINSLIGASVKLKKSNNIPFLFQQKIACETHPIVGGYFLISIAYSLQLKKRSRERFINLLKNQDFQEVSEEEIFKLISLGEKIGSHHENLKLFSVLLDRFTRAGESKKIGSLLSKLEKK